MVAGIVAGCASICVVISACAYIAVRYHRVQSRRIAKQQDASRRLSQISDQIIDSRSHGAHANVASARRVATVNPLIRGRNTSQRVAPEPVLIQSHPSHVDTTGPASGGHASGSRLLLSSLSHARVRQHPRGRAHARASVLNSSNVVSQHAHARASIATDSPLFSHVVGVAPSPTSPRAVHAPFDVMQPSTTHRQGAKSVIISESMTRSIDSGRRSIQASPSSRASESVGRSTPLAVHTQPFQRKPVSHLSGSNNSDPRITPGTSVTGPSFLEIPAARGSPSSGSPRSRRRSEALQSDRAFGMSTPVAIAGRSPKKGMQQAGAAHTIDANVLSSESSMMRSHHSHEAAAGDRTSPVGIARITTARAMTASSNGQVRIGPHDISSTVAFNVHAIEQRTASSPHRSSVVASSPSPVSPSNPATSRIASHIARSAPALTVMTASKTIHTAASAHSASNPERSGHIEYEASVIAVGDTWARDAPGPAPRLPTGAVRVQNPLAMYNIRSRQNRL